jgi:hypothetical protein
MVQKAQALARRRDSSLKHADEPCPGAFKPIAIPAVAAAVTVGGKLERRKRAERETPAILEGGRHLIVSGGLGTVSAGLAPVRLGVPPEIVVVELGGEASIKMS